MIKLITNIAKILLLDMDGTTRRCKSKPEGFINSPKDQELIPGVDAAIAHYAVEGWLIIGATNQGGVAAKRKTLEDCIEEQYYTLDLVPQLHKILFCPDYEGKQLGVVYRGFHSLIIPSGYSSFRKPAPGMIEYAIRTHEVDQCKEVRWGKLPPSTLRLFVGDREEDLAAAVAAGVPFLHAQNWRKFL